MKKLAILSILVFTFFLIPSALEAKVSDKPVIYVSAGSGFDNNPGTETRPFRSLAKAVDALAAGGTCYLMEGQYREKVLMKGLHGSEDAPVLITAVPGAVVTFRGTKSIEELKAPGADWTRHDGQIYKLKLKEDIWQLFVNGQEMVPARWPNGFFNDSHPTVYSHESFGHCTTYTEVEEPIVGGDGDVVMNPGYILKDVNGNVVVRSKEEFPTDITGAIAIMNIGSWSTWARTITAQHSAKEFVFQPQIKERQIKRREQMFFLEGKLAFLDAPTEWFYDRNTKTLYLWTPDGEKPSGKIKGKVQSFAMTLGQCKYVTIKGIRFFGTSFTANECQHLVVEDCVFDFPHTSRRMLGEPATVNLTSINAKINQWSPSHCRVINCELRETDGPAIILGGYDNHIENCLFERIDWTGTTGHGYNIDVRNAPGLKFRRNTVRNTGGCEGVSCPRSVKTLEKNGDYEETEPWLTAPYVTYDDLFPTLIELNRLYDMGKVQSDGAHVDAGSYRIPGMMFRYNWAYRSDKNGLRFDGGGGWNNAPPGVEGTQHHNVVFGTRKLSCKGDRHFCFNNTCFDGSQQDIYVGGNYPRFNAFNSRSKVGNNACNTMSYSFNGENGKVPGELVSNFIGGLEGTDVKSLLVDVEQFDFRPRDMGGSGAGNANPLIDKGTVEHGYTVEHFEPFLAEEVMVPGPLGTGRVPSGNVLKYNEGITDGYKGSAPDIEAYEYASDSYWIPGRKEKKASSPIPGDGAKDMPLGRDLIFLNGYRAQSADIYLGTDSMAVAKADRSKVEFLVSKDDPRNIVDPAKYGRRLKPSTTYFWRVDTIGENGTERGDVWSFTTGSVAQTHMYEVVEETFTAKGTYDNPYMDVDLWVDLSGPGGQHIKIPAFWDGRQTFKVRMMATAPGTWSWSTGNKTGDSGLDGKSGSFSAAAWTDQEKAENPNRRGIIRVAANGHTLEYPDGTPFFLTGDTCYSALTKIYSWSSADGKAGISFQDTVVRRKAQGFNSFSIISCFPSDTKVKLWQATLRGEKIAEDGSTPFEMHTDAINPANFLRINPSYFQLADRKLQHMWDNGFVPLLETVRRHEKWYDEDAAEKVAFTNFVRYLWARWGCYNMIFDWLHWDNDPSVYASWLPMIRDAHETLGGMPYGTLKTAMAYITCLTSWYKDIPQAMEINNISNWPRTSEQFVHQLDLYNISPPLPTLNIEPFYPGWAHPPSDGLTHTEFAMFIAYGSVLNGGFAGHVWGDIYWGGVANNKHSDDGISITAGESHVTGMNKFKAASMGKLKAFMLDSGHDYRQLKPATFTHLKDHQNRTIALAINDSASEALGFVAARKSSVSLKDFPANKEYTLQWWDIDKGRWQGNSTVTTSATGTAQLPVAPDKNRSWAFRMLQDCIVVY